MRLAETTSLIAAFARCRRLDRIERRRTIESIQQRWLTPLLRYVGGHSPYYRRWANTPFSQWPVMDKAAWMSQFDSLNTVGARLHEVMDIALRAEETRDFTSTWRGYTVGLSTDTSGSRGPFLVDRLERAQWAGTLLGKLLRGGVLARERIALVLRAGSSLYETIGVGRLSFEFIDQSRPWGETVAALEELAPTILVAPARVLRTLADAGRPLSPRRVVSCAEVLDDLDKARIESGFGCRVEQVYQAAEGLLGTSCEQGTVHLNEPNMLIEPQWQDPAHTRFVPIVTDLRRRAQPVIRYRLNDVLRTAARPCPCGRAAWALEAIEGTVDDALWVDGAPSEVAIFPDVLSRSVVKALPQVNDYEIQELARGKWRIALQPLVAPEAQSRLAIDIQALVSRLGGTRPELEFAPLPRTARPGKQRRVRGMHSSS